MRKSTPPLNALRAFEAAARLGSFSKAADDLCVTPGAISQQVAGLESYLGIPLFDRVRKRLQLTEAGRAYLPPLTAALDRMEAATVDLLAHGGHGGDLTIGALPTLAERWLIPRLPQFQEGHPEIRIRLKTLEVNFATPNREPDLHGGQIDLGLFFGDGNWPGLAAEKLMEETLVPVAAAEYLAAESVPLPLEVIRDFPLLHHSTRPGSWRAWFNAAGLETEPEDGHSFEHFFMLIEAVRAGLGIGLLPMHTIADGLATGQLVKIHPQSLNPGRAYYIIHEQDRCDDPKVCVFKDWLRTQVRDHSPATAVSSIMK